MRAIEATGWRCPVKKAADPADALYKLYDERMSAYWQEKCKKAAQTNSPLACAEKLLQAIGPLLQKRAGDSDFSHKGSLRFPSDPIA